MIREMNIVKKRAPVLGKRAHLLQMRGNTTRLERGLAAFSESIARRVLAREKIAWKRFTLEYLLDESANRPAPAAQAGSNSLALDVLFQIYTGVERAAVEHAVREEAARASTLFLRLPGRQLAPARAGFAQQEAFARLLRLEKRDGVRAAQGVPPGRRPEAPAAVFGKMPFERTEGVEGAARGAGFGGAARLQAQPAAGAVPLATSTGQAAVRAQILALTKLGMRQKTAAVPVGERRWPHQQGILRDGGQHLVRKAAAGASARTLPRQEIERLKSYAKTQLVLLRPESDVPRRGETAPLPQPRSLAGDGESLPTARLEGSLGRLLDRTVLRVASFLPTAHRDAARAGSARAMHSAATPGAQTRTEAAGEPHWIDRAIARASGASGTPKAPERERPAAQRAVEGTDAARRTQQRAESAARIAAAVYAPVAPLSRRAAELRILTSHAMRSRGSAQPPRTPGEWQVNASASARSARQRSWDALRRSAVRGEAAPGVDGSPSDRAYGPGGMHLRPLPLAGVPSAPESRPAWVRPGLSPLSPMARRDASFRLGTGDSVRHTLAVRERRPARLDRMDGLRAFGIAVLEHPQVERVSVARAQEPERSAMARPARMQALSMRTVRTDWLFRKLENVLARGQRPLRTLPAEPPQAQEIAGRRAARSLLGDAQRSALAFPRQSAAGARQSTIPGAREAAERTAPRAGVAYGGVLRAETHLVQTAERAREERMGGETPPARLRREAVLAALLERRLSPMTARRAGLPVHDVQEKRAWNPLPPASAKGEERAAPGVAASLTRQVRREMRAMILPRGVVAQAVRPAPDLSNARAVRPAPAIASARMAPPTAPETLDGQAPRGLAPGTSVAHRAYLAPGVSDALTAPSIPGAPAAEAVRSALRSIPAARVAQPPVPGAFRAQGSRIPGRALSTAAGEEKPDRFLPRTAVRANSIMGLPPSLAGAFGSLQSARQRQMPGPWRRMPLVLDGPRETAGLPQGTARASGRALREGMAEGLAVRQMLRALERAERIRLEVVQRSLFTMERAAAEQATGGDSRPRAMRAQAPGFSWGAETMRRRDAQWSRESPAALRRAAQALPAAPFTEKSGQSAMNGMARVGAHRLPRIGRQRMSGRYSLEAGRWMPRLEYGRDLPGAMLPQAKGPMAEPQLPRAGTPRDILRGRRPSARARVRIEGPKGTLPVHSGWLTLWGGQPAPNLAYRADGARAASAEFIRDTASGTPLLDGGRDALNVLALSWGARVLMRLERNLERIPLPTARGDAARRAELRGGVAADSAASAPGLTALPAARAAEERAAVRAAMAAQRRGRAQMLHAPARGGAEGVPGSAAPSVRTVLLRTLAVMERRGRALEHPTAAPRLRPVLRGPAEARPLRSATRGAHEAPIARGGDALPRSTLERLVLKSDGTSPLRSSILTTPAEIVMFVPPTYMNTYGAPPARVGNLSWGEAPQRSEGRGGPDAALRLMRKAQEKFGAQARYRPPEMVMKEQGEAVGKLQSQQSGQPHSINQDIQARKKLTQQMKAQELTNTEIARIVDRVYDRLERKIATEYRRRGF